MKNIIITPKRIKTELFILLALLIIAELINVYAIAKFQTSWQELYSQMGYVVTIAILLYVVLLIIRGLVYLVKRII